MCLSPSNARPRRKLGRCIHYRGSIRQDQVPLSGYNPITRMREVRRVSEVKWNEEEGDIKRSGTNCLNSYALQKTLTSKRIHNYH